MIILDDLVNPCESWVLGVIFIVGVGVALGYTDKERTAAQFITHPRTAKYLFRTGDLGRLRPSRFLQVPGREDDQVKGNVVQSNCW